jgi:hypothetical protein
MKIGIVELGGDLGIVFQKAVGPRIETSEFQTKKALDLFDVLAYARKMINSDQLVIIVRLREEDKDLNNIFYEGLAGLEAETGKNIFKYIYKEDDDVEAGVKELAETFFNSLFHPERLVKKEEEPEEGIMPRGDDFGP